MNGTSAKPQHHPYDRLADLVSTDTGSQAEALAYVLGVAGDKNAGVFGADAIEILFNMVVGPDQNDPDQKRLSWIGRRAELGLIDILKKPHVDISVKHEIQQQALALHRLHGVRRDLILPASISYLAGRHAVDPHEKSATANALREKLYDSNYAEKITQSENEAASLTDEFQEIDSSTRFISQEEMVLSAADLADQQTGSAVLSLSGSSSFKDGLSRLIESGKQLNLIYLHDAEHWFPLVLQKASDGCRYDAYVLDSIEGPGSETRHTKLQHLLDQVTEDTGVTCSLSYNARNMQIATPNACGLLSMRFLQEFKPHFFSGQGVNRLPATINRFISDYQTDWDKNPLEQQQIAIDAFRAEAFALWDHKKQDEEK
ncbi:MAG: hypothetical protein ACK5NY_01790 [Burkholderiaceae bacterium]